MEEILEFLKKLAANNDREWFAENKEEYLDLVRPKDAMNFLSFLSINQQVADHDGVVVVMVF